MIKLFKQRWWKALSILLLLYALIAGLYIPLGPGITDVYPASTSRGTVISLIVNGYNTHFQDDDNSLEVILKNEDNLICANMVEVINGRQLNVDFGLPQDLYVQGKKDYYHVIISSEKDGTFFLRDGFAIEKKDTIPGIKLLCATNLMIKAPGHITFPYREILYETIRNLFFHVPMWFTMIFLLMLSFSTSIAYLNNGEEKFDLYASEAAQVGILFGILGILTGMLWANYTWGAPWVNDPRLNGAAVGLLVYFAYFILRGSLDNEQTRAKVSAVYNIFAFVIYIVFVFVIPRMTDSLHPGSGGNPGFNTYDLDNKMRPVFYSSVIGFMLLSIWILSIRIRLKLLLDKVRDKN